MGRAEDRKKKKFMKKRLTSEQLDKLQSETNQEYINNEVNRQVKFFQGLLSDSLLEAFKMNGVNNTKASKIVDDVQIVMRKKVNKSNEQSKKTVS